MPDYRNNQQSGGFNRNQQRPASYQTQESAAEMKFKELLYKSDWIKTEADSKLVEYVEDAGKFMAKNGLTNSKIRSIYGEIKRIQMGQFEKEKSAFILLKPKVAYAMGRDERNEGLKLFKLIFDRSSQDVNDQKSFINFCNFMEAILAYHKANGGKD
ncbi:MAG: type III-A CRISPR-associated protein Csm2 [Prevotellaceae bacterium]|jgi:CRISPR-associated protein Csm2|nr:type III-A CRISPR-associated protein Csm2 [Prevotellaceae bacterium]